jgi:high-affinity iron transporter
MVAHLINFGVITIFAREMLEGGIIIGEYRTVILRSDWSTREVTQDMALQAVTVAAVAAAALAMVLCAAIAIPLAILSRDFNIQTASVIEGASKVVASICLLGLSLKIPKFFGLYGSKKKMNKKQPQRQQTVDSEDAASLSDDENANALSIRSIQFNVAWNIWREVAECGVFLIPFFLTGGNLWEIPLSAVIGTVVGAVVCVGIYMANKRLTKPFALTAFTVSLLLLLSTGLFAGGCHKFERVYGMTHVVWTLPGTFWSVERLPMTLFKPFGYSDTRTVLQMGCYWGWLVLGLLLHYRKYCQCRKAPEDEVATKVSNDPEDNRPTEEKTAPQSLEEENTDDGDKEEGQGGMKDGEVALEEGLAPRQSQQ